MEYGFIGAGNMAGAVIKGMCKNGYLPESIWVSSKSQESAKKLSHELGIHHCPGNTMVAEKADILVLGVKPFVLAPVLTDIASVLEKKHCVVVSIAAGKTLEYLAGFLPEGTPICRVMPNINAKIGASTSGLCWNQYVTDAEIEAVKAMVSAIGSVICVPEEQFGIFSVLAGAAPAFAYLYMDSLARAGVKAGMKKEQALEIVASTVLGSAKMILESGEHPVALVDQVCSPGGTTIQGVSALEDGGFASTITKAFEAVLAKDKLLGGK